MGKKGLSVEEKRQRILNIFYTRKEVFNLKEIENIGSKAGVVLQTIKDIVQSLIDDNLVEQDKIGAGNFLWALPSKSQQMRRIKIDDLSNNISELKTQRKALAQELENKKEEKPQSKERIEQLKSLKRLKELKEKLTAERDSLKKCSKASYEQNLAEIEECKRKANIWTDNIWVAKSWLMKQNPAISESDLNAHFGLPSDLDSID
ncbi:MND1 [Blepharisma stoltei]|uniref:Meiotic nuclear division protein 1 homolog n=1 Tax=Blepharisma stoltei TaxID=1481888 RepID=A0AAU9JXI5_9CILI|nr:unnamed protein product [Blepharisma stoltei]